MIRLCSTTFHRGWLICLLLAPGWAESRGGDWPQILGPQRNGIASNEKPLRPWAASGPQKIWAADTGEGFAGPAVAGSRVLAFHRVEDVERIQCLDAATGTTTWQTDFPATYAGGIDPDHGPRCVPLIHADRVYVFGAAGHLHCVRLADGAKVWSRDAYADFQGDEGYFGAGSTPIVVEKKLLVNVGGKKASIVAFDLDTGKTVWSTLDDRASYSSPILAQVNDAPHAVFVTRLRCVAVDPRSGKVAFNFPFGRTGPTVNAATPIVFEGHLFLTASYNIGARLAHLGDPARDVWSNDESMSSQYTTCVYRDGYLYGIHGREDFSNGELRCVHAKSGKVAWTVTGFGVGHPILVGDRLLVLTTNGQLVLAAARPDKYEELARATVARGVTRGLPAFSNGRLYFRENSGRQGRVVGLAVHSP